MYHPCAFARVLMLALLASSPSSAFGQVWGSDPLRVVVEAGKFDRRDTPIRVDLDEARLGPEIRAGLDRGSVALRIIQAGRDAGEASTAQVDRLEVDGKARLTWVLRDPIAAGESGRFEVEPRPFEVRSPWAITEEKPGLADLRIRDRPFFRYNGLPVSSPAYGPIQVRDGYIHPAYSPSGALITGDFSSSHPHHRGFFLAYVHTESGGSAPDFWNIQLGTGKIASEGLVRPATMGPVTARFAARHRWEAFQRGKSEGRPVLRETWDVETFDVPGSPYFLFDLTSTQQAIGRPMNVLPYRYGGMAYRGPEPFVKGVLDVLTSEGLHRLDGDGKVARWVDLTGPVADGSDRYAGAMIADHPGNPGYPTKARIHPLILPFFSFVPARDRTLVIPSDLPVVFRYRILIHDGRPDHLLDDRAARDFSDPPVARVE